MEALKNLILAACEYDIINFTAPSVTTSWLADKKQWYASVCLYTESFGRGKKVIAKAMHEDLETAILNCSEEFLKFIGRGPTDNIDVLERSLYPKSHRHAKSISNEAKEV